MFSTFRTIALAVIVAVLAALPAPTRAGLIVYDFSSNATMTIAGDVFSISGFFDFNTTTSTISAQDVTLKLGSNTETFTALDSTWASRRQIESHNWYYSPELKWQANR
jgi:hypothetical protein